MLASPTRNDLLLGGTEPPELRGFEHVTQTQRVSANSVRWHRAGWSLIELLVVIGLTAILAGTAVLNHQRLRPMLDLTTAARQVAMDLRATRMRAVGEAADQRIVFNAGAGAYQQQRYAGNAYVDRGLPTALPRGVTVVSCSATGGAISFRRRGNAGTFGTVALQNAQGDVRQIIVNITGRVRIQ